MEEYRKNLDEFIIRSPEEEFTNYVKQQIEMATRFDEKEKLKLYEDALDLGLKILNGLKNA